MRNFLFPIAAISFIPIVLIAGCSQESGPSQAEIQQSLKERVPVYSEIESFQIEKSENLGTETEPRIQARFTANLKITEDLYNTTISKDSILNFSPIITDNNDNVQLIRKSTSKGEKLQLYGLSVSEKYADTWKTRIKFDGDPFQRIGIPRSQHASGTVIEGSEEEKRFNDKRKEEKIARFFTEIHSGYLQDGVSKYPFNISFLPYDKKSGDLEGTILFLGGSKKNIKGNFSNSKLTFKTTSFTSGKDSWGLGTQYTFDIDEEFPNQTILGSWKHPGKTGGETSIRLK